MKALTADLKLKIKMYTKNKADISDLIKDVEIKGADLSFARIKHFHRVNEDLRGLNLYGASIGEEGFITSLIGCNLQDCNFEKARFLGRTLIHKCDARRTNFRDVFAPDVDYKFTDFRGATFCHAVLKIGTDEGIGCKFDKEFLSLLTKNWGIEVEVKDKDGAV